MDDELITKNLLYYIDVVSGDIDALEKVALNAEEEDQRNNPETPPLFTLMAMTTSSHGENLVNKIYASRCTVPLTMVCFSVLDFLGKLCLDNSKKESERNFGKKTKKGEKNIESNNSFSINGFANHANNFLINLAHNEDLKNHKTAKLLQDSYRHSIAHSFLTAPKNIISYSSHLDSYHSLFVNEGNKNILNVKYLTKNVKKGLATFKNTKTSDSIVLNNYKKEFNL